MNIIFAKPVHHYDSYTDFWKLVELSGFPVIYVDEIDITQPNVYITAPMNGDYQEYFVGNLHHFQDTREVLGGEIQRQKEYGLHRHAHLVLWNLERPSGSKGSLHNYRSDNWDLIHSRLLDEIWVSDSTLADETGFRYVVLGSDYGLGEPSDEKTYDFTHMSVPIPRRQTIYAHFGESQIGPNAWNPKRHEILKQSRFALNVHQDNHPYCEPLRMALFAAYGLPIISEMLTSPHVYNEVAMHNYGGLASALKQALNNDYEPWKQKGLALRKRLCEDYQFGKMVRKAVGESAGDWR